MNSNYAMAGLSFEITRRCNMNCDFCARGKAQNLDITKEIIDKTFNEIEGMFIHEIRLNGGEPFLCPDLMEYLIDSIIQKKLLVHKLLIFTNGTIRSDAMRTTIKKFLKYRHSLDDAIKGVEKKYHVNYDLNYENMSEGVNVIVSTYKHKYSMEEIQKTIDFYENIQDSYFSIVNQTESAKGDGENIVISGKVKENYKMFPGLGILKNIRIINNNYYFIRTFKEDEKLKFVSKTISVAANGNVYPGAIMEYNQVDNDPMFNILDCNSDFFVNIQKWCWQHPIALKAKLFSEKYLAVEWCREHGIDIKEVDEKFYNCMKMHYKWLLDAKEIAKGLHVKYPNMTITNIDLISHGIVAVTALEDGANAFLIKKHLELVSFYPKEILSRMSKTLLEEICVKLLEDDRGNK